MLLAIDLETTGLDFWDQVICVSYAISREEAGVLNVGHQSLFSTPMTIPQAASRLRGLIHRAEWVFFHNASFDLPFLFRSQLARPGDFRGKLLDTMVMGPAVRPLDYRSLKYMTEVWELPVPDSWAFGKKRRANIATWAWETVEEYAKEDAEATLRLGERVLSEAQAIYSDPFIREEGDFVIEVAQMTTRGIAPDLAALSRIRKDTEAEYQELLSRLVFEWQVAGPDDRVGIQRALAKEGIPLTEVTNTGQIRVDHDVLTRVSEQSEMVRIVLRARALRKQLGTWIDPFFQYAQRDGRIHARWTAGRVASYRLAATNPNLMAIPKQFRLWVPDDGQDYLMDMDLSQAELRLGAALAGEDLMAKSFAEGVDIHQATADVLFPDGRVPGHPEAKARTVAKRASFGAMYGGGAKALVDATGVDFALAQSIVRKHRSLYKKLREVSTSCENTWKKRGSESPGFLRLQPSGKRIYPAPSDHARGRLYHAFNQLVQGSIASTMQKLMLYLARKEGVDLLLQVHDSLLLGVTGIQPEDLASDIEDFINAELREVLNRTDPPIHMTIDYDLHWGNGPLAQARMQEKQETDNAQETH